MSLSDTVALIAGATRGGGRGIAIALGERGGPSSRTRSADGASRSAATTPIPSRWPP